MVGQMPPHNMLLWCGGSETSFFVFRQLRHCIGWLWADLIANAVGIQPLWDVCARFRQRATFQIVTK